MNDFKIKAVQIDVNGLCNAGCWFCPVSYAGNPKEFIGDMELEELDSILKQLDEGKGDFVDPDLKVIYSANYNEVLLYKNFEEMLKLYKKHNFRTYVLSNGIALTKQKVDIINRYSDVIDALYLNIPASDAESWSKYVKKPKSMFNAVLENLNYAFKTLEEIKKREWGMVIMVNGIDERSLTKNGGWVDLLENAPDVDLDVNTGTLRHHIDTLKKMFPEAYMLESFHLYDRAGQLGSYNVITQEPAINKYLKPKGSKVIGCNGGIKVRSRTNEWIHINANGDLFICCNDYDFKTIYGNINKSSLKDIWYSKDRTAMIENSYSDLCTKCSAAIWG